jgi:soluble lytic murein transglycosylase-like protein
MIKITAATVAFAAMTSLATFAQAESDRSGRDAGMPYLTAAKQTQAVEDTNSVSSEAAEVSAKAATATAASSIPYSDIITRYATQHGVPVQLAKAVVRIESNFKPNARGRAGEIGLMQIKPATARGIGFTGNAQALYDPETNIRYGMKYLAKAHQLAGGDLCGTILRYNAGHGARRMNPISANYCRKVQRIMGEA